MRAKNRAPGKTGRPYRGYYCCLGPIRLANVAGKITVFGCLATLSEIVEVKKTLRSTLAVALLLFGATWSRADEAKPVLVVSVTSIDRLIADVDKLGEMAESQLLTNMVKIQAANFTKGVDTKKPCGFVVTTDGTRFKMLAFIPVTDFKALMTTLRGQDAGDGAFEVQLGKAPAFAKEKGGWAFLSDSGDNLADLPDDPLKLLAGQEKEYDVTVRALVSNVPENLRELAMASLKSGIELADRLDGETQEEFDARMKMAKDAIDNLVEMANDTEHVTLGWSVDGTAKKTFLDMNYVTKSGSKTAKKLEAYNDTATKFAGFLLPDAAARMHVTGKIAKEDGERTVGALKTMRDRALKEIENAGDFDNEEQRKIVKSAFNNLMDSIDATVKSGEFDGAGALVLMPDAMTVVAAGHLKDPSNIEKSLKEIYEIAKNEPGFPEVKFNAETHKGVRMHTMKVPVKDPQASKFLGENMDVVLGFADSAVYFAAGRDAMKTLKAAIDESSSGPKEVPPMELTVSLGPIINFAASMQAGNPVAKMMADEVAKFKGKDNLRLTLKPIKNGVSYRFEIEQGILNLAGKAIGMFGAGASF
jgi:hypothetical protein